ncbi:thiol reductant ABC exporter subunit CydC [Thiolapillus sp.]|uniref:thiol reductant ABC exporter subunit CydC n=1 Tax=Thiolapillus sp. TaxID=2017437 RepID=UPI003AF8A4E8
MKDFLRLVRLFRPYYGWLALGLLLSLVTLLANVVLMSTSGWFIAAMGLAGIAGVTMNYFTPAAIIRACAIVRTTGRYGERLITHDATLRVLSGLRVWFYRHLEPLAPGRLGDYRSGDLLSRMGSDIDALDNTYLRILLPLSVAAMASLVFLGWLYWQQPRLALAEAGLLCIAGLLFPWWLAGKSAVASREIIEASSRLRTDAVDALQGLGELVLYGADTAHGKNLRGHSKSLGASQLALSRWSSAGQSMVLLCAWTTVWLMLVLLAPAVAQGSMPPANLPMFALFALASFEAVTPLPLAFQSVHGTLAAARRLFSLVDQKPLIAEETRLTSPAASTFGFEFRNVDFHYPRNGQPALEKISFTIPVGSKTAILGPTGAGKSTLVNLMLKFHAPDRGDVFFAGSSLAAWPAESLRQHLAVVDQHSHLFIGSIRQNLLLADPSATEAQLEAACETACILDWIRSLPDGLNTEIGEAALRISGGEARRLAIARSLLKNAPVLILDEPTEGLDPVTSRQLMKNLLRHCEERSFIIITHQINDLPEMDQIILLDKGQMKGCGSHRQLLVNTPEYQALQAFAPVFNR